MPFWCALAMTPFRPVSEAALMTMASTFCRMRLLICWICVFSVPSPLATMKSEINPLALASLAASCIVSTICLRQELP